MASEVSIVLMELYSEVFSMVTISSSGHSLEVAPDSMIILKKATEDDYFTLANEDLKVEFDGECLYIHSPATKKNKNVVFNLLTVFKADFRTNPTLGEAIGSKFALKLPTGKRSEPDVVIVAQGVVNDFDSIFEGIPLMVIEILSPSTRDYDLNEKRSWYQEVCIKELWFIDLDNETILIDPLITEKEYESLQIVDKKVKCFIFPDLEILFSEIFRE